MSDSELDRSVLDTKDREELHQIAGAMGVNAATRMKKADLIDAILGATDGGASESAAGSDGSDRPKRVRWWRMEPVAGEFTPSDEVDEIRWLSREEAAELLSYDRDLVLLDAV